jgi:hypothetical protein
MLAEGIAVDVMRADASHQVVGQRRRSICGEIPLQGTSLPLEPQELSTCSIALLTDPGDTMILLHLWSDGTHGRQELFP